MWTGNRAGNRLHPLEALAEALVTIAYRESRLTTERTWAAELKRLNGLRDRLRGNGPHPAEGSHKVERDEEEARTDG